MSVIENKMAQFYPSAFTIDVEDGVNIGMKDHFGIVMPPTERVLKNTDTILELFKIHETLSTFFILGEVAEKYPDLVKKISLLGHELGIHGYFHDKLDRIDRGKARADISRAKDLVEQISGKQVYGFRAPAFSINQGNNDLLETIAGLGFSYDSSLVPAEMGRYGWKGFSRDIVFLELKSGNKIIEAPLPVIEILGKSTIACGGGYLRYFPYLFTDWAFRKISLQRPLIVYIHPYELDRERYPDFFYRELKKMDFRTAIPLYLYRLGKGSVEGKINKLLDKYRFMPLIDIIESSIKNGSVELIRLKDLTQHI